MRPITVLGVLLILHMATSRKLVCHMTNWAQYRPGNGRFTSDNIDPFLCTHIIFNRANINSFNQIHHVEWNDVEQYARLNSFKNVNPYLKTLLTVGGYAGGQSPYITVVSRPENRATFIRSAIKYLRDHNFDGLNIAWDYPAHNGSPPSDRESFTLLLSELATAFEKEAKEERKIQLLLSADVASLRSTVEAAYEVDEIANYLDFINVKAYDFHGSWESRTGHNSPLYRSSMDYGYFANNNINASISHWLDKGAPADKLLLGIATYGRTFRLSTGANGLGAPANGPASAGPYTNTQGFWSFYEVCDFMNPHAVGFVDGWIAEQFVPYAAYASSWVGYDNQASISHKVQYMTVHNLGGAHVWTLDMDDFSGSHCSAGVYPLVNHLRMSMGFGPKPTINPAPTNSTRPNPTPGQTPAPGPNPTPGQTTTAGPVPTRDPVLDFCKGRPDGLYKNPADATTYFQCSNGFTHLRHCQPGLVYWENCRCCNWP